MMNKENKKKSFESSIKQLEDIIDKLESGNVSLEESVSLYEKGIELQLKYPNQMVAGTMMAQALRIYKSTLKDDDFKSMIETIVESESKIQPYDKPTLN